MTEDRAKPYLIKTKEVVFESQVEFQRWRPSFPSLPSVFLTEGNKDNEGGGI